MPAISSSPTLDAIRRSVDTLAAPGQVVELRILDVPRVGTVSGYFDGWDRLAQAAAKWDGKGNLYVTLNEVSPALLARAANRMVERPKTTTSDSDIVKRLWLPLDFDPVRPSGISSTDREHEAALKRARDVRSWFGVMGWPEPVLADSGNGGHLLYRVDLPNDLPSKDLIARCLEAVSLGWSDDAVQ